MKKEYNWLEFEDMMDEAGFNYVELKGFWSWVTLNGISDSQLSALSKVIDKLAKGK